MAAPSLDFGRLARERADRHTAFELGDFSVRAEVELPRGALFSVVILEKN